MPPPTTDQLDTDYRYILAATLAACRGKNFRVQICAVPIMLSTKGGFVTFNTEPSKERRSMNKPYDVKERMEEWLDAFITSGVLTKDRTLLVYVYKDLVGAGMPGIGIYMRNKLF